MEVLLAEKSGFCFGVERAVKIAEIAAKDFPGKKIFTLGDIIHNPTVVESLEEKGIKSVESLDSVGEGDVLIIRSHGAMPEVFEQAEQKGLVLLDATCPNVKRAQKLGSELNEEGHDVIVIGSREHPEVKSLAAYSSSENIISEISDINEMEQLKKPAVITQTTLSKGFFEKISNELKKKFDEIRIINTICRATSQRQDSAKKLAEKVDVMIVVGGRKSSNTNKLAEICREIVKTYHIETPNELDSKMFNDVENVGVTAGASTPKEIIESTIEKIKNETFKDN